MSSAFILCAGFGTRLRPLTLSRPKPLMPIVGVPMLAYSLALLKKHGFTTAIVNAHYLADQLRHWEGVREGVQVIVSNEQPDVLGTGGGLQAVIPQLDEQIVVLNGDILTDVDLGALHRAVPEHGAALALRPTPTHAYGAVCADATGSIVQLRAFSAKRPPVRDDTHFTGIHSLKRSVLANLTPGFSCIVGDRYLDLAREGLLQSTLHTGLWLDIGAPQHYLNANLQLLRDASPLALNPFERAAWARDTTRSFGDPKAIEHAQVNGCAWIGRGAVLNGASITNSVVGENATLAPGCSLDECVVWDGVRVPAGRWKGTIFFTDGQCTP